VEHGYPELTPELRRKVFAQNAARVYALDLPLLEQKAASDAVARDRVAYQERPDPSFLTHGPRTRRELLALWARRGGRL
jgi:hypothetical protein